MDMHEVTAFERTVTDSPADVLRRARKLIDEPGKWMGTDGTGYVCALSAIGAAGYEIGFRGLITDSPAYLPLKAGMWDLRPDEQVQEWNDRHTHAEVMQAFDAAIALAERQR